MGKCHWRGRRYGHNGASEDIAAEEVHSPSLTQDDVLHGYSQDEGYNVESMEYDGNYPEELEWDDLKDLPPNIQDIQYPHYNGNGPCLRNNVSRRFDTILGSSVYSTEDCVWIGPKATQ
eukprot:scaffold249368_cov86-Cyclotella_meneghiniana.AAC.1